MVDSINPTSQDNGLGQPAQQPVADPAMNQPLSSPQTNPFYSGFNKPNEVHVNLADAVGASGPLETQSPQANTDQLVSNETLSSAPAPDSRISDFRPPQETPSTHQAYSGNNDPINWRGILFISGIGLFTTVVFGIISYFSANAIYKGKLTTAETELAAATNKLNAENETPEALELPVEITTPTAPTTETPAPVEQPIQTPETAPVTTPNGGTEANG